MSQVFGSEPQLARTTAERVVSSLSTALNMQCDSAGVILSSVQLIGPDDLLAQLRQFRVWFDPTAKGERLRALVGNLSPLPEGIDASAGADAAMAIDGERYLVTPEGYLLVWLWHRALTTPGDPVRPAQSDIDSAQRSLLDTYRVWTRRRLEDVVGLLTSETSTLRPAAAGLLLTLLVNRNTSADRSLRRPRAADQLASVSAAISDTALAYAEVLGGRRTSPSSVDLYRGWALGELRRRLGTGFHSSLDDGIWLDSTAEQQAIERLVDDVRRRDEKGRSRVKPAISAALAAYETCRPQLAALGLAYERPGNTDRLRRILEAAAEETPSKS
ncbi:MAG: hypothetical protein JWM34_4914 [Ilumatobacteraceae bacterium]|nr:hypothetical protein [Ilumatobacteraceae bacterium]